MSDKQTAKTKIVDSLVELIKEYPIVGAVNMENLPTAQLQNMREQLRSTVVIKMTKKRLIKIALKEASKTKPGIEKLEEYLRGMPALIFTKDNPFKLFKTLKKNKSTAPAKGGQTATKDIIVKAGPTPFAPGPIIGELGMIGIKAGIDAGKVAIKEDKVVVKDGEEITAAVAALLTRLKIEPMEVGLDLSATFEDGIIFTKSVLDVDEDKYVNDLATCASWAFNLAMESAYPTKDTIKFLIGKAFSSSKAVAIEQGFLADGATEDVIGKVERTISGLKSQLNL